MAWRTDLESCLKPFHDILFLCGDHSDFLLICTLHLIPVLYIVRYVGRAFVLQFLLVGKKVSVELVLELLDGSSKWSIVT